MPRAAALVVLSALALSCGPAEPDADVRLGTVRSAVIGGGASDGRDGVVFLAYEGASGAWVFQCTAALIAPNLVVTARHCVSNIHTADVACESDGRQVSGEQVGADLTVDRYVVHVGKNRPAKDAPPAARGRKFIHDGSKTLCGHDIAFIVLDKDIPNAPLLPVRADGAVRDGESVVAIGYGVTKGEAEPAFRHERTGVRVAHVGPFEGDADEPPVAPRDFLVGESFCQGDSGGPALSAATGAVVGIATRVANGNTAPDQPWDVCTETPATRVYAFYTQFGAFGEVTRSAFAEAGHKPWLEGARDPRLPPDDEGCSVANVRGTGPNLVPVVALGLVAFLARARRRQITGTARGRSPARTDRPR